MVSEQEMDAKGSWIKCVLCCIALIDERMQTFSDHTFGMQNIVMI